MDWPELDSLPSDRLWLWPLGLVCGRAAAEAVASNLAYPLGDSGRAFTLIRGMGLRPDRHPVSVTGSIAELEAWLAGAGARFAARAEAARTVILAACTVGGTKSRQATRHGGAQRHSRQLLGRGTVVGTRARHCARPRTSPGGGRYHRCRRRVDPAWRSSAAARRGDSAYRAGCAGACRLRRGRVGRYEA